MAVVSGSEPIDLVYTWVDDQWPGYLEQLNSYSENSHDRNPNRTRDNLELLRYSLRSVERYLPWIRNIHILSCRPQVPKWLNRNHPQVNIIHHDEIMAPAILPTFNSFAIITHLHKIPGLSDNFIYSEDDMLFGKNVKREVFVSKDGLPIFYPRLEWIRDPSEEITDLLSPWNCAQININRTLDEHYGVSKRRLVSHTPLMINRAAWQAMQDIWPTEFQLTKQSRFRASNNLAPEVLYPHYMVYTGQGRLASLRETYRHSFYYGIENSMLLARLMTWLMDHYKTDFIALNDNMEHDPKPAVVSCFRKCLSQMYPVLSHCEVK